MLPSPRLTRLLKAGVPTVVLTGAGISAESGVPTFRGGTGSLWDKFDPTVLASVEGFLANQQLVWEWYAWRRKLIGEVEPNAGHLTLARMQNSLPDFTLITQNVDNLHQRAGSEPVIELHGNIHRNKCHRCGRQYRSEDIDPNRLPTCSCGGAIRPDVVWFGEMLPREAIDQAMTLSERSQLFFSIGTSAEVFPAADLPLIAKQHGAYLVEINPDETRLSQYADEIFREKSGTALPEIWRQAAIGINAH